MLCGAVLLIVVGVGASDGSAFGSGFSETSS